MKNQIILFSNVKGGTGKSCLCGLFCSFLAEKGAPEMAIDADIQQTLFRHRQRELTENPDATIPWQLQPFNTSDMDNVKSVLESLKQIPACVIIDCPGNINDPTLSLIYKAADIVVVPTRYDSDNLDATCLFVDVFKVTSKAKMFFVPNSIAAVEERREEVMKARDMAFSLLGGHGYITPRIKQSVVVKCYSTVQSLTSYQRNAVKYAFEPIVESISK